MIERWNESHLKENKINKVKKKVRIKYYKKKKKLKGEFPNLGSKNSKLFNIWIYDTYKKNQDIFFHLHVI